MPYLDAKVYFDGSHYIAIPHTVQVIEEQINHRDYGDLISIPSPNCSQEKEDSVQEPSVSNCIKIEDTICKELTTRCDLFNQLYDKYRDCNYHFRKAQIIQDMLPYFSQAESCEEFVKMNLARKQRNKIVRRVRMSRKAYLAGFNYFCTFTYDDKKHTEESFKKGIRTCLRNFCYRKNWKYMGVWERAPETGRLHFHGLFNIPEGTLPGEIITVSDYSTQFHKMQQTFQSTYFNQRFGRSDFKEIDEHERKLGNALAYLTKYIEKTNNKIVYSKNLPQYFISDIANDDVVCRIGQEDKKLLLFDNFKCIDTGVLQGTVSPEVIAQMKKSD